MGLVMKYPDCRSIYRHPNNAEEFKELYANMQYFKEIGDIDGVFTTAMQLIPIIIEKDGP